MASGLETLFEQQLIWAQQSEIITAPFEREFQPIANRRFRIDFAFTNQKIGIEIQGGLFVAGRHNRGPALINEWRRHNLLTIYGWQILYITKPDIENGLALNFVVALLNPTSDIIQDVAKKLKQIQSKRRMRG